MFEDEAHLENWFPNTELIKEQGSFDLNHFSKSLHEKYIVETDRNNSTTRVLEHCSKYIQIRELQNSKFVYRTKFETENWKRNG